MRCVSYRLLRDGESGKMIEIDSVSSELCLRMSVKVSTALRLVLALSGNTGSCPSRQTRVNILPLPEGLRHDMRRALTSESRTESTTRSQLVFSHTQQRELKFVNLNNRAPTNSLATVTDFFFEFLCFRN